MGGKKTVEWQSANAISTPSQIHSYIESCKEWLLSIAENEEEHEVGRQHLPMSVNPQSVRNIGVVRDLIYDENVFDCFLCKKKTLIAAGRIINANPFTRSQHMLTCADCAL